MRKKLIMALALTLSLSTLSACGAAKDANFHSSGISGSSNSNAGANDTDELELSENILIGLTLITGTSELAGYESLPGVVVIYRDHRMEVYFDDEMIGETTLTDSQYETIERAINFKKLYSLDPESDHNILDGDSSYYYLYGRDDKILTTVGGYEPSNDYFISLWITIRDNVPYEWVSDLRYERILELCGLEEEY